MQLHEPYRPRAIRHLGHWHIAPLRMKVHGIAYRGETPAAALCDAARQAAEQRVAARVAASKHLGAGFVGIHEGREGNFVFVDWWADENELHHHVYVSRAGQPHRLEYRTPSALSACAWDLRPKAQGQPRTRYRHWVIGRGGRPCRVRGMPNMQSVAASRRLHHCPVCQA